MDQLKLPLEIDRVSLVKQFQKGDPEYPNEPMFHYTLIREEIAEIEAGADKTNNVLKNAPHTQYVALQENWDKPYSREKAVFPLAYVKANKFWPSVSRIDSAYGDRNLICACIPTEEYAQQVKDVIS